VFVVAGLQQKHPDVRICRQAIRKHTAGCARAGDDVVEFAKVFHGLHLVS